MRLSPAALPALTVTAALPCPPAVDSKVAAPVPEESAVMVTFCAVFQFDGVKVSDAPPVTESGAAGAGKKRRPRHKGAAAAAAKKAGAGKSELGNGKRGSVNGVEAGVGGLKLDDVVA